jgi:hypothetical protein
MNCDILDILYTKQPHNNLSNYILLGLGFKYHEIPRIFTIDKIFDFVSNLKPIDVELYELKKSYIMKEIETLQLVLLNYIDKNY